ncbi:MAG: hypothetical protein ABI147_13380 [Acidobacteriaceae bacterium]
MKKLLAILGITALIFVAIVSVTGYNQKHSQPGKNYDVKCVEQSQPQATSGTLVCAINARQEAEKSQQQSSVWDVLTTWPESITAWLLLLTLIAISWQAWETREAAIAASEGVRLGRDEFVATFRPRIHVRSVVLLPQNGTATAFLILVNNGGTNATIMEGDMVLEWMVDGNAPRLCMKRISIPKHVLHVGEDSTHSIVLGDDEFRTFERLNDADHTGRKVFFACNGRVRYADKNGTIRITGFERLYNFSEPRFIKPTDSDFEYED